MKTRSIIILGLALLSVTPSASAQSFKERFQKATEKIGQQVKQAVSEAIEENSGNETAVRDRSQKKKSLDAMLGQDSSKSADDQAPTVRLPKTHTALFAPLGYPEDAKYGVRSAKPSMPPKSADAQADWREKQPDVFELDNKSLVDEYVMLAKCVDDGYVAKLTPAYWRYDEQVKGEILARTEALNELVEQYDEALSEYDTDSPEWVINDIHGRIARVLDGRAYKTLIRSSIAPLFSLEGFIDKRTREYFKSHGGYENAAKEKLTVWDPNPVKESISTSESGQSGTVVSENKSGATVDIGGVVYVLHNKNGRPSFAFISEVVKTVVAGKDIVIPDNVMYNGGKYPVREMRGDIFRGTTIKSVKLPSTLREIPNSAFRETSLTEVVIPASVKRVQGSAFYGCTKLTKVVFEGEEIEELHGCFQNCTSLKSIRLPRRVGLTSYGMFEGCVNLTDVTLPENLTEIGSQTFSGCRSLKSVAVPPTVTKVGDSAFAGSGVVELDLSGVREFGLGCFLGCKSLKTVKLNASLKEDFLMETYDQFVECPLLQVKFENGEYVYPAGFIFVDGK